MTSRDSIRVQVLGQQGAVPFDRMLAPEALQGEGLRIEDFEIEPGA
jgi:hypothetical protein